MMKWAESEKIKQKRQVFKSCLFYFYCSAAAKLAMPCAQSTNLLVAKSRTVFTPSASNNAFPLASLKPSNTSTGASKISFKVFDS